MCCSPVVEIHLIGLGVSMSESGLEDNHQAIGFFVYESQGMRWKRQRPLYNRRLSMSLKARVV